MKFSHCSLLLGCLISTYALADNLPLPPSLLYKNQPIDALCIYAADKTSDLEKCGINAIAGRSIVGKNAKLTREGYFGYDYQEKDMGPAHAESYYRFLGKKGNDDLIYTIDNGGGSGEFTAIKVISRHKNTITVKTLDAGDRCNGGISNVLLNNHLLFYRVNLTPWDLIALYNDNPLQLKAYDDLVACAVCCAGTATFYRKIDHNINREILFAVDFTNYSLAGVDVSKQPYQQCFNKVITEYKARHQTILTAKQFKDFTETFNKTCRLK